MKTITQIIATGAALFALLAGATIASATIRASDLTETAAITTISKNDPASIALVQVVTQARYIETRGTKRRSIKSIRAQAIRETLGGLGELRPYTTNYKRLKSAIRSYWKRNVKRPSTKALAKTMMRYVKRSARKDVRSDVYSGAAEIVADIKKALKRR